MQIALELGSAVPTIAAAVDARILSSMRTERLRASRMPAGAHTYQRADRPEDGFVHTDWETLIERTSTGGARR
ncbi:MAG: hypothetical protein K2Y23_24835 [Cyanobacteria bacterium]|nr:hypothetical protein [Cyanobacteriota bacterium]